MKIYYSAHYGSHFIGDDCCYDTKEEAEKIIAETTKEYKNYKWFDPKHFYILEDRRRHPFVPSRDYFKYKEELKKNEETKEERIKRNNFEYIAVIFNTYDERRKVLGTRIAQFDWIVDAITFINTKIQDSKYSIKYAGVGTLILTNSWDNILAAAGVITTRI